MSRKIFIWPGVTLINPERETVKGPGGADLEEGLTNVMNKPGQKDMYGNDLFVKGGPDDQAAAGGLSELNPGERENAESGAFSMDGPYVDKTTGKALNTEADICDPLTIGHDLQYSDAKRNFDVSGQGYDALTKNGAYAIGSEADGVKAMESVPKMVSDPEAGPNTVADRVAEDPIY